MMSSIYAKYCKKEIAAECYKLFTKQIPKYDCEEVPEQHCQVENVNFC